MTTLNQPKHIISLASSAVLVSADVSIWNATKSDKQISKEVTKSKKADDGAGRFTKNLLVNNVKHKAISNYRQTIDNWINERTYGWNKSQSLLPAVYIPTFKAEWQTHETNFYALLDDFISDYDFIVSNMAFSQGDMFNRDDYPDKEVIRAKFKARLFISEVPSNDFRCQIANDLAQDLHNTYSKQTADIMQALQNEQAQRLVKLLTSISNTFTVTTVNGKESKGKVFDSTIEKTKELVTLYREFNLSDNPIIRDAVNQLENTLSGVTADAVRGSNSLRKNVKDDVDELLTKFGAFQCV